MSKAPRRVAKNTYGEGRLGLIEFGETDVSQENSINCGHPSRRHKQERI